MLRVEYQIVQCQHDTDGQRDFAVLQERFIKRLIIYDPFEAESIRTPVILSVLQPSDFKIPASK